MAQRRVASSVLAIAGGVLMPFSLFFDWYHLDTGDSTFDIGGWDAFETADLALVAASLVALYVVLSGAWRPGAAFSRALLLAGGSATGVVVIQLINEPPLLAFGNFDIALRVGAVLGLAGAILVFAAGVIAALGER